MASEVVGNAVATASSFNVASGEDQNINRNSTGMKSIEQKDLEAENLLNLLYNVGESQAKRDCVVHRGISCNICNVNPLAGVRYKCSNCIDYDICSRCEPLNDHDKTHIFLKIVIPLPPLANPRSVLLPTFYPGKAVLSPKIPWSEILELRVISHFEPSEIEYLYEQFKSLCTNKTGITKEVFCHCLGPLALRKNVLVEKIFKFYDRNGDGYVSFSEYIKGLSVLTKGTQAEKIKYIFKAYDVDDDGFISNQDLLTVLQAHHQISVELVRDVVKSCEEEMMENYDDSGNRPISAIFNAPIPQSLLRERSKPEEKGDASLHGEQASSAVEAMTQDAIQEIASYILKKADADKDGLISFGEFKNYVSVDPSLLTWFESIGPVF